MKTATLSLPFPYLEERLQHRRGLVAELPLHTFHLARVGLQPADSDWNAGRSDHGNPNFPLNMACWKTMENPSFGLMISRLSIYFGDFLLATVDYRRVPHEIPSPRLRFWVSPFFFDWKKDAKDIKRSSNRREKRIVCLECAECSDVIHQTSVNHQSNHH
jgi:hypothetical protein